MLNDQNLMIICSFVIIEQYSSVTKISKHKPMGFNCNKEILFF